jgi:hypothetical protein
VRGRRNLLGVQLTGKCAEDLARVRPVASEDRRIGAILNATNVTVVTAPVSIAADLSIYVIVLVGHSAAQPTLSLPPSPRRPCAACTTARYSELGARRCDCEPQQD